MRAAWRQHVRRKYGSFAMAWNESRNISEQLGSIWERLISWGVISEEDARILASGDDRHKFYSDSGARLVLSVALQGMVEATRKDAENMKRTLPKKRGFIASMLRIKVKETGVDDGLDDRVLSSLLETPGVVSMDEASEYLDWLKQEGHYDQIIKEALAESSNQTD
jgi:hypothetical protein